MTILKLVTFLNWIIIAFLALIFIGMTIFPSKGGDAATKGLSEGINYLALFLMLILLTLNLLPWTWTRYLGLALVIIPICFFALLPQLDKMKRRAAIKREEAKPIFEDANLEKVARLIQRADTSGVKKWIEQNPELASKEGELLGYAIAEAAYTLHHQKDFLQNVKLLFEAGATLKIADIQGESPIFITACAGGNPDLIFFLIQKGADPNARDIYYDRPALLSASSSSRDPKGSVRVLLENGADPEVIFMNNSIDSKTSIMWDLCYNGNWEIAQILLEYGADPDFKAKDGYTPRSLILEFAQNPDYSKSKELLELAELLKK
ncbi:MAG: ankyrin repeat domain-containing protein [Saprospiraceae bacterium]|nr:ankyrin repeat domain-containing protein [Saprospiraceae bacterium]